MKSCGILHNTIKFHLYKLDARSEFFVKRSSEQHDAPIDLPSPLVFRRNSNRSLTGKDNEYIQEHCKYKLDKLKQKTSIISDRGPINTLTTCSWHVPTPLHELPDELICACVRQSESTKRERVYWTRIFSLKRGISLWTFFKQYLVDVSIISLN